MKVTSSSCHPLSSSEPLLVHHVIVGVLLILTGCQQTNPLLNWDPQSENLAGLRLIVEAEGVDFDAYPYGNNEVLFTSTRADNLDVYLASLDGGVGATQMTTGSGVDIFGTAHPDGQQFVFLSDWAGGSNLYYYLGERGKPTAKSLVAVAEPAVGSWKPAQISPDGKTLLYTSGTIWTYDMDNGEKVQLVEGYDADWHPDGQRIVFTRVARNSGGITTTSIWVMNADGTDITEIVPGGDEVSVSHPRISPDGQRISYERATVHRRFNLVRSQGPVGELRSLSDADIWIANIDGTGATQLTTHPMADARPNWVDDRRLVFSSERPVSGDPKDRDWNIWMLELQSRTVNRKARVLIPMEGVLQNETTW